MSYVVLARKWRPQTFDDLVGQEHVSRTLANAIAQDRVAHAFLFTGVRGVGKTTSARILAKALNCAEGPTATPCGACDQCLEIARGADMDVQEIDGASYNGVDEVRRLQESLPYRPGRDRYKIVIVDEVHMLSNAAWNAFLKTLEEPPPHVKFIFATTEVHKVPVTILSRCQRYDFKLIGANQIVERLRQVIDAEGIKAEDGALAILAREAAGSMRDAMSLLDQVIAWAMGDEHGLSAEAVAQVLGVPSREVLHRLAQAILGGKVATCLEHVDALAREGYDLNKVGKDLLDHLRDLVLAREATDPNKLLQLGDKEVEDLAAVAKEASLDDLVRLHQMLSASYDDIVKSPNPRHALELTLVRMARRPPLVPIDKILERLGALAKRIGGGGGGPQGGASGSGPGRGAPSGGPDGGSPRRAMAEPSRAASVQTDSPSSSGGGSAHSVVPSRPGFDAPARPQPRPPEAAEAAPAAATRVSHAFDGPAPSSAPPRTPAPPSAVAAPSPAAQTPSRPVDVPPPSAPPGPPPPGSDTWERVVDEVRRDKPALASILEHASFRAVDGDEFRVGYAASSFLLDRAREVAASGIFERAARAALGKPVRLVIDELAEAELGPTLAQAENQKRRDRVQLAREAVEQHPLIGAAMASLGAQLREIRLPPELRDAVYDRL